MDERGDLAAELLRCGALVTSRVRGASMDPTIRDGDLVSLEGLNGRPAQVGDVIAFERGPLVCLHRVIAVVHDGVSGEVKEYLTAGDGLLVDDGRHPAESVLGRVVRVRATNGEWRPDSPLRRLQSTLRVSLSLHPWIRARLRHAKHTVRDRRFAGGIARREVER